MLWLAFYIVAIKQKITNLTFSEDGVAEIKLKSGKIILVHDGNEYQTTRE